MIPILKKNKPFSNFQNYRPISLTSILGKAMERMINCRLNWYTENQHIIHPAQAGFRHNRSTEQQVVILSQQIKDNLDKGYNTTVVYVDFEKAYDSVWKSNLLLKLSKNGVSGKMLQWFKNFLSQRYCQVRFGDTTSKFKQLQTGLPQGAVTSCSLFNLYINDLVPKLTKYEGVNALLYADDLVLWSSTPKSKPLKHIEHTLNSALEDLHQWCLENSMKVNITKTSCQTFSLCHKDIKPAITYNNAPLEHVSKYKYLGVTFDTKLTWKDHIADITARARGRLNILKRLAGTKWGCATSTLNSTYKTYVKPVMKYCCGALITAPQQKIMKLEHLHNQAMRMITGTVKPTPITSLLLCTSNMDFKSEIIESALKIHEKLNSLQDIQHFLSNSHHNRKLKTQESFLQKVRAEKNRLDISWTTRKQLHPAKPLEIESINYNLELITLCNKEGMPKEVLKQTTLETIENRYPLNKWLHQY